MFAAAWAVCSMPSTIRVAIGVRAITARQITVRLTVDAAGAMRSTARSTEKSSATAKSEFSASGSHALAPAILIANARSSGQPMDDEAAANSSGTTP